MTDIETRARIGEYLQQLGPDELAVALVVVEGLACGRSVYGEMRLASDPRDFKAEARDELRDSLVYIGAELVRLRRRDGRT